MKIRIIYITISILFVISLFIPICIQTHAANLSPITDEMSNETLNGLSSHNITFDATSGISSGGSVTINFPTGFTSLSVSGATSSFSSSTFSLSGNTITVTDTGTAISPGTDISISGITATNPSTPSTSANQYIITVSDSSGDSASLAVAIINSNGNGLDGTSYKQTITINNTTSSVTLTNYQLELNINTQALIQEGEMQSSCADIRFQDSLGNNLSYWLQPGTCYSSDTIIFVNVPTIPASSDTTIYMYYGSPSATSQSDGSTTFPFFDNFSSSVLNSSVWTSSGGSSCYSITPGNLTITCGSIYTNNSVGSQPGLITEAQVSWSNFYTGQYSGLEIANAQSTQGNNTGSNALAYLMDPEGTNIDYWTANGTSASYYSSGTAFTAQENTPYILGSVVTPSNILFYENRNQVSSTSTTWSYPYYIYLGEFTGAASGSAGIPPITVNWVLTREYAANIPTVTFGSVENLSNSGNVDLSVRVNPYITFSLSSNSLSFGIIYTTAVSKISNSITASTNAALGINIMVQDQYSGLENTGNGNLIPSSTTTLSPGTAGYGINATSSSLTISSPYNGTGTSVGALSNTYSSFLSSSGPISNDSATINYLASTSNATAEGTYTDNINYIVSGNF